MRLAAGAIALFVGTSALGAQSLERTGPDPASAVLLRSVPGVCPVEFSATRIALPDGVLRAGNDGREEAQTRVALHLVFHPQREQALAGARVTFRGLSGLNLLPAAAGAGERTETFTLGLAADAHHLFSTDVWSGKLSGVTSVELDELTYADGTVWRRVAEEPCRIAPDALLLVSQLR
jgi:hypothetical protein